MRLQVLLSVCIGVTSGCGGSLESPVDVNSDGVGANHVGSWIGATPDGRLDVFVLGPAHDIQHATQATPNGSFGGFTSFGGYFPWKPTVATNSDGRQELFAVSTSGDLFHKWNTTAGGSWSDGWSNLGEGLATGTAAVGMNSQGNLDVFVRKGNGYIAHIRQHPGASGGWDGWLQLTGATMLSRPAVGRNSDGRLELFAVGTNQHLWHIWETSPSGSWSGWSDFGGPSLTGDPVVAPNADGRLEVFATGTDGGTYHIAITKAGGWSNWARAGTFTVQGSPVVARNADGRLEVFARGTDDSLYHVWQNTANGAWTAGGAIAGVRLTSDPDVSVNANGLLQLFWLGDDGAVGTLAQMPRVWAAPATLGAPLDATVDVAPLTWPAGQEFPSFPAVGALDVFNTDGMAAEQQTLFTSLEGLINRTQPRIYAIGSTREGARFWLDRLGVTNTTVSDPFSLLTKYRSEIGGLVIYDNAQADTINLATTIAGVRGGVVASPTLATTLGQAPYNLPVLADLRQNRFTSNLAVYQYAFDQYWSQTTHRLLVGLSPGTAGALRDYAVATRAMVIWLDPSDPAQAALLTQFTVAMPPASPFIGWWANERAGVGFVSRFGVPTLAADLAQNLSVHGGTSRTLQNALAIPAAPALANKIYVAMFMSDGDNVQINEHLQIQRWTDAARGSVPISWTISPGLLDLAPDIFGYYRSSATANDTLVSGPSGLGYTYPDTWTDLNFNEYIARSADYLQRAGLRIITIWNMSRGAPGTLGGSQQSRYAGALPSLLGLTDQDGSGVQVTGTLPKLTLAAPYAGDQATLQAPIDAAVSSWNGKPAFVAVQGNMNVTAMTPTTFAAVRAHYQGNGNVVFVRGDHFFMLMRQARGLPQP